jgi:hypothetical protein
VAVVARDVDGIAAIGTSNHSSKRRIFHPYTFDLPSAITVTAILLVTLKVPLEKQL